MITFKNVKIKYQEKIILENINLHFKPEQHYLILGENGCGKSTLLKAIFNLIPYSGEIFTTAKIAYIPQNLEYYFLGSTVWEEVVISWKKATCKEIKNKLKEYQLEAVENQHPITLSGGEKVRLAILIAILQKPDVIILDETMGINDYQTQKYLEREIKNLKKTTTIIEVSHDLKRIDEVDQVIVVKDKQVIAKDQPVKILQDTEITKYLNIDEDLIFKKSQKKFLKVENYVRND